MDTATNPSTYDIQYEDNETMEHLTEINRHLKEELKKVKNEFSQTLDCIPDIKKVHEENNKLNKKLCESQALNDDLQKRLNIALQSYNELIVTKRGTQNTAAKEYENQMCDLQIELCKIKTENDNIKQNYMKQIKNTESSFFSSQTENSILSANASKLLKAAEAYFSHHYDTINDLTKFLNQPPVSPQKDIFAEKNSEIESLKEKITKLKSIIQNEKQKVKALQIGVLKYKKKTESEELQTIQKITNLQDQIKQQENEINCLNLLNQQKKIEKPVLKYRNQYVQASTVPLENDTDNLRNELSTTKSQINEDKTTISMLKMQLDSLNEQIKDADFAKSQLLIKNRSLSCDNEDLLKQLNSQKKLNQKLTLDLEDSSRKLTNKAAESTNPKEKVEAELCRMKLDLNNSQKSNQQLEDLLNRQKEEIEELTSTKENLIIAIEKQSKLFAKMDQLIKDQKPKQQKVIEKEITLEPIFNWQFGNLPLEILDIVTEVAENDSISIESRIKSIFIVINKWIENQQSSKQKEILSLTKEKKETDKKFENYKKEIVKALDRENVKPEDAPILIEENIMQNCKLLNENTSLKNENKRLLSETECKDFDDLLLKYNNMNNSMQQLTSQIKDEKKKRSTMRIQINKVLSSKDKELSQKTATLKKMNENSRNQVNQLQSQVEKLAGQNRKLIKQISTQSSDQIINDFQKDTLAHSMPINSPNDNDSSQLQANKEANQLNHKVKELTGKIEILNKAVDKWQKAAQEAQNEAVQQKKNLDSFQQENENQISLLTKTFEGEKRQLQQQIQDLTYKLSQEVIKHNEALNELTNSLTEVNQKYDKTNQDLSNQKFEIEKAHLNAASRIEAVERSKKLSEAQLKAKILSIESNHVMIIEEEKQKYEREKRNLIDFFINNFKDFSDINDQLDDDSFKGTVKKVKFQVEKGQKTVNAIRKLIKAKDSESTEDALTQFIIRMHPQFQASQ